MIIKTALYKKINYMSKKYIKYFKFILYYFLLKNKKKNMYIKININN